MTATLALGAALLVVAGLLALPLELRFQAPGEEDRRARLEVRWLFGRLRREIRIPPRARGTRRRGSRRIPAMAWLRAWRAGLVGPLLRLLRRLRRWVRVDDLRLRARVGLGDPAETGMLLGWVSPIAVLIGSVAPGLTIRLEADFTDEVLEGSAAGAVRILPLGALPPLILFALSPATLRAARELRRHVS